MTSLAVASTIPWPSPTDTPARVSFRQPVAEGGFVDAGWWPRSLDLTVELPPLLDVLWTSCREITRVSYNVAFWDAAPRRLEVAGRFVRLGGFRNQSPLLLSLVDAWGHERIDLLVIPPDTEPAVAERALVRASAGAGTDRPARMLELARAG